MVYSVLLKLKWYILYAYSTIVILTLFVLIMGSVLLILTWCVLVECGTLVLLTLCVFIVNDILSILTWCIFVKCGEFLIMSLCILLLCSALIRPSQSQIVCNLLEIICKINTVYQQWVVHTKYKVGHNTKAFQKDIESINFENGKQLIVVQSRITFIFLKLVFIFRSLLQNW